MVIQVLRELWGRQGLQVQMVSQGQPDLMAAQDLKERQDSLDLQEELDPPVKQGPRVKLDHQDQQVRLEGLVLLVLLVNKVLVGLQGLKELLVPQDLLELLDPPVKQDLLVMLGLRGPQGTKDSPGQPDK